MGVFAGVLETANHKRTVVLYILHVQVTPKYLKNDRKREKLITFWMRQIACFRGKKKSSTCHSSKHKKKRDRADSRVQLVSGGSG